MAETTTRSRPRDPNNPRGVNSASKRAERLQLRGQAQRERVERARRDGSKINSGEGDLADELDLEYEQGVREGMKRGRKPRRPAPAKAPPKPTPIAQPAAAKPTTPSRTPSDAFPVPSPGSSLDRAQGRTLIMVFTTIAALGAVARDTILGTPANPTASATSTSSVAGSSTPKEPVHLRSLAGVFVVGTIALVLNEISPTLGVSMSGILLLDVGLSLVGPGSKQATPTASLIDYVGGSLFNGSTTVAKPAQQPTVVLDSATTSTSSSPAQPKGVTT